LDARKTPLDATAEVFNANNATAAFFNTKNAVGHYCCLFLTQGRHLTPLLPVFNAQQRYSCFLNTIGCHCCLF
jgi:hypothetical protein